MGFGAWFSKVRNRHQDSKVQSIKLTLIDEKIPFATINSAIQHFTSRNEPFDIEAVRKQIKVMRAGRAGAARTVCAVLILATLICLICFENPIRCYATTGMACKKWHNVVSLQWFNSNNHQTKFWTMIITPVIQTPVEFAVTTLLSDIGFSEDECHNVLFYFRGVFVSVQGWFHYRESQSCIFEEDFP